MKKQKLTIMMKLKAGRLSVQSLLVAVQDTVRLLEELQKTKSGHETELQEWDVESITMRSPLHLTITQEMPRKSHIPSVVREFMTGMKSIETSSRRPKYFSNEAMGIAGKLTSIFSNGVGGIAFSSGKRTVTISEHAGRHIEAVLSKRRDYETVTQLEGRLEMISIHEKQIFCIYDVLNDQPIRCTIDPEKVAEISALLPRRARIRVCGLAKYNKMNKPVSIVVYSYEVLPEQKDLPQIKELHSAGIDITHGEDSVEHTRGQRNGD